MKPSTEAPKMKIKAIAPWFGGKRRLAPRIVKELGPHFQYFEPFCGAAAVLFAKPPSKQETVNDLHGDLVNLAMVLQDEESAVALYDRCVRTLFCGALLKEAEDRLAAPSTPVHTAERAYWYFVACWMARNGVAGTDQRKWQLAVRWTAGGGSPTIRWRNVVDSIPAWHERLRNVVILSYDAFDIIPRFQDATGTTIYVDPPYPHETRTSVSRSGKYLHDFDGGEGTGLFAEGDAHARLAEILNGFKHARIVVSTYDCDRMRQLYAGWTVVECGGHKQLAAQNKRGQRSATEAREILLINGPSLTP